MKPVKADVTASITHVDFPTTARPGLNVRGLVNIEFSAEGPEEIMLPIYIRDVDPDTPISFDPPLTEHSFDRIVHEGEVVEAPENQLGLEFTAIESPTGIYPFHWDLEAEIEGFGDPVSFMLVLTEPDSDPMLEITNVALHGEEIIAGYQASFDVTYEYSLPELSLRRFEISEVDGEILLPYASGAIIHGTGVEICSLGIRAPLRGGPFEWSLLFAAEFQTPEEDWTPTPPYELTVDVSTSPLRWLKSYGIQRPSEVARGEEFPVTVNCEYSFPETFGPGRVRIRILDNDESSPTFEEVVEGDSEHILEDRIGEGIIRETFHLTVPLGIDIWLLKINIGIFDEETGEFHGGVVPERSEGVWYVLGSDFDVRVSDLGADHWARIEALNVNLMEPPVEVSFTEDFTVTLTVSWSLPDDGEDRAIHIFIEDLDGLEGIVADQPNTVTGASTGIFVVLVESVYIPPRNGPWNLRAYVKHSRYGVDDAHYVNAGYERRFAVNIIGFEDPAEFFLPGTSDWKISNILISPVEPFIGSDVTFDAIVEVETEEELPQRVEMSFSFDEMEPERNWVTYEGGDFLRVPSSPWTPTLGEHTIIWEVDPDREYDDANPDNNIYELAFTVSDTPPLPPGWEPPEVEDGESEEEFDFYITATPTEQVLASSISYTITVEHISGPPNPVQIEVQNAPASVSFKVDPPSGNPSYSATMTVTASSSLPAGTYHLTIKAVGDGKERYTMVTFIVEDGPSYQLQAQTRTLHAMPGETVEYVLTVSSENGYNQYVSIVVSGLPSGVNGWLNPSADKPDFQSILSVEVGEDVNPGTYSFIVSGSGVEPKRVTLTLFVREAAAQQPVEEGNRQRSTLAYYLPLLYLATIIAAIVAGSVFAVRRLRGRPGVPKSFCIECGKKIPVGTEFCPKCGVKQKE